MSDIIDLLEIPEFLKRTPGDKPKPAKPAEIVAAPLSDESWKRLEAVRKEQKLIKARGRVAKMLARKADKAAAAAGKVWDTKHGGWK